MNIIGSIKQIHQDNSLWGHGLRQIPNALNQIADSKDLYFYQTPLKYLELGFRRIGVKTLACVATIVVAPISFAIKLINLVGSYIAEKLQEIKIRGAIDSYPYNVVSEVKVAIPQLLENITSQIKCNPNDFIAAKFFIKVTCDSNPYPHEFICESDNNLSDHFYSAFDTEVTAMNLPDASLNIEITWFFALKTKDNKFANTYGYGKVTRSQGNVIFDIISGGCLPPKYITNFSNFNNLIKTHMGRADCSLYDFLQS